MPPRRVVEALDVVEHARPRLVPCAVGPPGRRAAAARLPDVGPRQDRAARARRGLRRRPSRPCAAARGPIAGRRSGAMPCACPRTSNPTNPAASSRSTPSSSPSLPARPSSISPVAKWTVGKAASRATPKAASLFLDKVLQQMPFPVRGIQVDGGPEFKAEFETACQTKSLVLYELPPKSPSSPAPSSAATQPGATSSTTYDLRRSSPSLRQ